MAKKLFLKGKQMEEINNCHYTIIGLPEVDNNDAQTLSDNDLYRNAEILALR